MTLNLEPIKERLAAATPGPWFADDDGGVSTEPHAYTMTSTPIVDTEGCGMGNPKDSTFIAHAPSDLAALIAEVEQLRKRIKRYQGKLVWVDLVVPVAQMHAWDEGYNAGKRDYAASIGAGASIVTDNPYLGLSLGCRHD